MFQIFYILNFEKNALAFFSKLIFTMNSFDVFFQGALLGSPVVTMRTSKRSFSSMDPHVIVQICLLASPVVTMRTSKRFFSSMSHHVFIQNTLGLKSFTTFFTFVLSYSCNLDQKQFCFYHFTIK